MGVEILVSRKNDSPERSFIRDQSGMRPLAGIFFNVDHLTDQLGQKRLTDFFDAAEAMAEAQAETRAENNEEPLSDEEWERLVEENTEWFPPEEAAETVKALIGFFEKNAGYRVVDEVFSEIIVGADVIDDLRECLDLINFLIKENDLFHFVQII